MSCGGSMKKYQPGGPVADSTAKSVVKPSAPPKTDAEKKAAFNKALERVKTRTKFADVNKPQKATFTPFKKGGSIKKK